MPTSNATSKVKVGVKILNIFCDELAIGIDTFMSIKTYELL